MERAIIMSECPEYFILFQNTSQIKVQVKFKESSGSVQSREMQAHEIIGIVSHDKENFLTRMTFDEHSYEIYKYDIDPINKVMTNRAKRLD